MNGWRLDWIILPDEVSPGLKTLRRVREYDIRQW
jgi:hypothetical protein